MKKNLLHILLGITLVWNSVSAAHAETDPKMTFFLDCNTIQKQVNVGFVSNPDNPNNGPAIIAFKYVLTLSPSGATTPADIAGAIAKVNPALSNVVIAENKSEVVGNNVKITVAGGFTGGNGLPKADFLFDIEGTNQKGYLINVTTGELYAQNSTSNSYVKNSESFAVNPASCTTPTPTPTPSSNAVAISDFAFTPANITIQVGQTVTWTNNGDAPHTVTSTDSSGALASSSLSKGAVFTHTFNTPGTFPYKCNFHPNMTGTVVVTGVTSTPTPTPTPTSTGGTTIAITSDKASAKAGETFTLTAVITKRNNQSVDWAQVSGGRIDQPTIVNTDNADGTTTSKFTAKMPANTTADLVFKLSIGSVEERFTVASEDAATTNAAPTTGTGEKTLAELLEERRAALSGSTPSNANTTAGNVHAAAGGLSQSGPGDVGLLVLGSFVLLMGWKRLRRLEV